MLKRREEQVEVAGENEVEEQHSRQAILECANTFVVDESLGEQEDIVELTVEGMDEQLNSVQESVEDSRVSSRMETATKKTGGRHFLVPPVDMSWAKSGKWPNLGRAINNGSLSFIRRKIKLMCRDRGISNPDHENEEWLRDAVAEELETKCIEIRGNGHCFFDAVRQGLRIVGNMDQNWGNAPFADCMEMRRRVAAYLRSLGSEDTWGPNEEAIRLGLLANNMTCQELIQNISLESLPPHRRWSVGRRHYAEEATIEIIARIYNVQIIIVCYFGNNSAHLQVAPMATARELGSGPIPDIYQRIHLYRYGEHYTLFEPSDNLCRINSVCM